jgi:hypothetical protein
LHETLRVTWRVTPLQPPLVRRHCSRCAGEMPFAYSMKFRTNAQKKRIDVWLIYRCIACDEVWNLPIFERVGVGEIAPDAFDAIARNDPAFALRHAFDRTQLMRHGSIEGSPEVSIHKSHPEGRALGVATLIITLALALPCGLRLDRLLAGGLGLTRTQLGRLHDAGLLRLLPFARKALRNPAADGQTIAIDLASLDAALAEMLRRGALA